MQLDNNDFEVVVISISNLRANIKLTIHNGKTCALVNSVQKFIEMQSWLLLACFIYLHSQLSSFNSIIVQTPEKRDSSNRE